KKNVPEYRKISRKAGKIWIEHGALEYRECVADDIDINFGLPFPKLLKLGKNETAIFSWIVYKSSKHRDQVNAKVMQDPRLTATPETVPFDSKRMTYGGFQMLIDL